MEKNKGFAFYENMWTAVESFPEEQQMQAIWAIVKYGITGEMVDPAKYPFGAMAAGMVKPSIDSSVERFNSNSTNGSKGGRPSGVSEEELAAFLIENPKATSKQVGEYFGISASAVQKREAWKNRKNPVFDSSSETVSNSLSITETSEKPKFDF